MSRRFSVRAVLEGFAYRLAHHPSFYVSVIAHLICATATVGFILAFIQQASYTGNTRRLNIVIIAALLGAVLFTSCFLILARIIAVRTSFNTIPKPYIPTKHIDVPRKVAEHISREYTRTGVIAYISQPTAGKQEGWGRPGSQFASIHFRKSIRETFHVILKTLDDQMPGVSRLTYPPYAICQITSHPAWPTPAQPLLDMYDAIFTKAKYARSEPDAEEYERCIKIVALIMGLIKTTHHMPLKGVETPTATKKDLYDAPASPNKQVVQSPPQAHLASPHSIRRHAVPRESTASTSGTRASGQRVEHDHLSRSRRIRHGSLMALFDEHHHHDHDASVHAPDRQSWAERSTRSPAAEEASSSQVHERSEVEELREAVDLHAHHTRSLAHPPPYHPAVCLITIVQEYRDYARQFLGQNEGARRGSMGAVTRSIARGEAI
ncbi:hypothetical protein NliqN6_6026 [Naganishia liquefaciens]|uniref:Defect at low temperature protein 1 n=1 Tax=Naganishia liquefaciens TaxID=104408 RepID=A0A8H3TYV5_9TREE|nr:hypothetical protein NliqN6_6026 [Naganishia liquefaciens]